ncbi:MAG: hypothetical protein MRERC_3c154 [Mycoplasmataceae bacterium RC_NB112A]|nr:MAG: hypothetical protein MRERC_3c154 [Mycoplasmataceae bacterium RC_NB112A]
MAGHSHSANIKWRKDRQDSARSQIFVRLRKKIENILREEGKLSEKPLTLARENKFPKEKVYQIWEKISQEIYSANKPGLSVGEQTHSAKQKKLVSITPQLYQARFGIVIYLEANNKVPQEKIKQLSLKELPLVLFPRYFQLIHSLKIELKEKNSSLEEILLTNLPLEIWEKANYDKQKQILFSSEREAMKKIKNLLHNNDLIIIQEEKKDWKNFLPKLLNTPEEKKYFSQLQKKLENFQFHTNVEKERY